MVDKHMRFDENIKMSEGFKKSKSILEIVTELTGQVPIQYSGELKAIKCFMHDDQKPSLVLYPSTQSWFCYPCSQGGDIYRFVALYKGISYHDAKVLIDGNNDVLEEIIQTLDGLHVKEEVDYSDELNMSVSKTCRDIMSKNPEKITIVMEFLKKLDGVLKTTVNRNKMQEMIEESRKLLK